MLPDKYFSVSLTATNLMLYSFSLIYTRPCINHPNVCAVYSGIFRRGVLALVGEVLKTLPSFLHIQDFAWVAILSEIYNTHNVLRW